MSRTFVCYSRQVQGDVTTLASELQDLGHDVWFDQALRGGQTWWEEILANIRRCEVFIAALCPETLDSQACNREWSYAAALGKSILPVMVGEKISSNLLPPALSRIQLVDYRDQDRQAAFALIRALDGLPPPTPLPDPLPESPPVPISYLSTLRERIESSDSLSFEEQSAILLQLEEGARDEDDREDILALIHRLGHREDLLARIDKRVSALQISLASGAEAKPDTQPGAEPPDEPQPGSRPRAEAVEPAAPTAVATQVCWKLTDVADALTPVLRGVADHAHVWRLQIDEDNALTVSHEKIGQTDHLAASITCRDGLLSGKQNALDKLGWSTKDRGVVSGIAGSALLYATGGAGLVALGSKKVRDFIMTVEASRRWPVSPGRPELSAIASELKVALEIIGPEAVEVIARPE